MVRIRKLSCFDYPKIKKLIPYLGSNADGKFLKAIFEMPLDFFNGHIPLKYRFRSESFILLDNDEILGMVTVEPTLGNPYKINITRLIFKNNFYDIGKQLIDYIVAKYGARGAHSFIVYVDQSHDELCSLFVKGCGFRQCSYENLWKLDNFKPETDIATQFRACQDSDSKAVARLYNSELNTLYKPSMERIPQEYKEIVLHGFNSQYKNRYVLEECDKVIAYLSITTSDNMNFVIDLSLSDGYQFNYDEIINFALSEISRRKSNFTAFLKHRQYAKNADKFEEYLHSRNLNCVQTQCVLVKDFYKPIKETEGVLKVFSFGENILTN